MTAEVKRKIFEPFFTTKEVGKGTGMGLANVYGFVAQARGAITVESQVSSGTTLRFVLPTIAGPGDSATRFIRVAAPGTGTILLAEDDHHVRQLALLTLKTYGYTIKLPALRPMHIQTMLSALETDEIGARTRQYCYVILRRAFTIALKWQLVGRNPCLSVCRSSESG